jgi:hypothetical protein
MVLLRSPEPPPHNHQIQHLSLQKKILPLPKRNETIRPKRQIGSRLVRWLLQRLLPNVERRYVIPAIIKKPKLLSLLRVQVRVPRRLGLLCIRPAIYLQLFKSKIIPILMQLLRSLSSNLNSRKNYVRPEPACSYNLPQKQSSKCQLYYHQCTDTCRLILLLMGIRRFDRQCNERP